ncbi:MAG: FAD-dependent monooxygenase [Acidobacteria bacterium]|nr:FAD-dependent monooxygenase [Acidobacteriota bacterium]
MHTPVLIVGGGPAGLTTATALARYGVGHVLVNKYEGTAHTPRAHIVNQRTVEIMRHLGCEDDLLAVATPQDMMRHNLWVTSLAGREVARLDAWGTGADRRDDYAASSPSPMVNCPQTVFEPMLLRAAKRSGADVRFGHEFIGYEHDGDEFVSTVRVRRTGEQLMIRSRHVVGADGARSSVMERTGLAVEGRAAISHAVNIWFRADLSQYLAHRPGVLTWFIPTEDSEKFQLLTLICHKPFSEFVLVLRYDPVADDISSWSVDDIRPSIEAAVGASVPDLELLGVAGWQVNGLVAPRYSADGVHCMGDAVHRHPPTNGLGLNMSVADGYNLAWKLALVEKGLAGTGLLDTYSSERQPVGATGVARALQSAKEAARFGRDEANDAGLTESLRIANYQFNAHGVELGYCYDVGAVVHDAAPYASAPRDAVLHHHATTRPGARLAHAWLEREGEPVSSLDLVDGLAFSLLTGTDDAAWVDAADAVSRALGIDLLVHRIGVGGIADPNGDWIRVREVDESGCVLVRPDRHVGWRSLSSNDNSRDALLRAMRSILAR